MEGAWRARGGRVEGAWTWRAGRVDVACRARGRRVEGAWRTPWWRPRGVEMWRCGDVVEGACRRKHAPQWEDWES